MKTRIYHFAVFFLFSLLTISCISQEEEVPLSTENTIQSITITKGNLSQEFKVLDNSITGKVNSDFELNDLSLKITLPKGATISPDPATIKSITTPFTLTITAENGDAKVYNVLITRELSVNNSISEFNISSQNMVTAAKIDESTGIITKRLPEFVDFKNLNIDLKFSKYASISPDPATVKDFTSPVNFTVKSESGLEKVYQVKLEYMDVDSFKSCADANSWKWFGGDDRTNAPDILPYDRNVGTGQTIIVDKDLVPSIFSIDLREGFKYYGANTPYYKAVTLKLIIRDENFKVLETTTTTVAADFTGGLIPFDLNKLNLLLEANKKYLFFWYLVDGESVGVYASSPGNSNAGSGFCFNSGYTGESKKSKNTTLEEINSWYKHEWHFNIELKGKE